MDKIPRQTSGTPAVNALLSGVRIGHRGDPRLSGVSGLPGRKPTS